MFFRGFSSWSYFVICIFKVLKDGKVHDTRDPGQPLRLGSLCSSGAVSGYALPAVQQRRSARKGACLSAGSESFKAAADAPSSFQFYSLKRIVVRSSGYSSGHRRAGLLQSYPKPVFLTLCDTVSSLGRRGFLGQQKLAWLTCALCLPLLCSLGCRLDGGHIPRQEIYK